MVRFQDGRIPYSPYFFMIAAQKPKTSASLCLIVEQMRAGRRYRKDETSTFGCEVHHPWSI